jgi:hypothetical protein
MVFVVVEDGRDQTYTTIGQIRLKVNYYYVHCKEIEGEPQMPPTHFVITEKFIRSKLEEDYAHFGMDTGQGLKHNYQLLVFRRGKSDTFQYFSAIFDILSRKGINLKDGKFLCCH